MLNKIKKASELDTRFNKALKYGLTADVAFAILMLAFGMWTSTVTPISLTLVLVLWSVLIVVMVYVETKKINEAADWVINSNDGK